MGRVPAPGGLPVVLREFLLEFRWPASRRDRLRSRDASSSSSSSFSSSARLFSSGTPRRCRYRLVAALFGDLLSLHPQVRSLIVVIIYTTQPPPEGCTVSDGEPYLRSLWGASSAPSPEPGFPGPILDEFRDLRPRRENPRVPYLSRSPSTKRPRRILTCSWVFGFSRRFLLPEGSTISAVTIALVLSPREVLTIRNILMKINGLYCSKFLCKSDI